jgi:hypothetical protein
MYDFFFSIYTTLEKEEKKLKIKNNLITIECYCLLSIIFTSHDIYHVYDAKFYFKIK